MCNLRKEIVGCRDKKICCVMYHHILEDRSGIYSRGAALLYKGVGRGSLRDVGGKGWRKKNIHIMYSVCFSFDERCTLSFMPTMKFVKMSSWNWGMLAAQFVSSMGL